MSDIADRLSRALADRYRLDRELGQGGMATVYLAHDLKNDRDVAIKVLRDDVAASVGRERFLREIQLGAKLSHPHILPLYDSGDADGALFYVMPVVQGQFAAAPNEADTVAAKSSAPAKSLDGHGHGQLGECVPLPRA